ncbi:MAG: oxidase [Flavipsychrobacter sp.]|jgi:adenylyltransferase/sulfurtransferase|nr:oxidase [Flavipsychrobacter sp.]
MNQVSPSELKEWIASGKDFLLVDVREGWERQAYNIGGVHIPMGELMSHANDLARDKDVVLYCEKGIRTVIAIQRLEAAGFHNLVNLSGGMKAWKESL